MSDLAQRILLGEDSTLELKRVQWAGERIVGPDRGAFSDEIAAFANARGGTLVLGVDDKSRHIVGIPLERLDAAEAWVGECAKDLIRPITSLHIRKVLLPDGEGGSAAVLVVEVPRSPFVHRSANGYFQRFGPSKLEMMPDVLARLFQERSQSRVIRYDETPVPGTSPADAAAPLAARFLREAPTLAALRKLKVVVADEDGVDRLSLAGTLLCTPQPEVWLPHATVQAVAYAGERRDPAYQLDARDFGGPLDVQVADSLHFLRRNLRIPALKHLGRQDIETLSDRAAFEVMVNAVAHRDYSVYGSRIRLHLFPDRLELYVPGALPNTLTTESMALRQYSRNELVVSLLARCAAPQGTGRSYLMDRRGDGVPIILEESRRVTGREAVYTVIDGGELQVVLPVGGVG